MSDPFDIEPATTAIEAAAGLVEANGLPAKQNAFDPGDNNGRFVGDLPGGATISGQGSVVVQGSIAGSKDNPCRIRIEGDLVVTGRVQYAQIRCRNLSIGDDLIHAKVKTSGDTVVGGQIAATELILGEYEDRKLRIESLRNEIARGLDERESFDHQINQEERRVDRSCKATRIPLNFNVSRLISQENGRVRIDLSSFYSSLGDMPEAKLQAALIEFFAKGIVGVLARANRKYIGSNTSREKVFLQLLKTMRELFVLVSERDLVILRLKKTEKQVEDLVDKLREQACKLHVQQGVGAQTQIEFHQPRVRREVNGDIDFVHRAASVKFDEGNSGELRLALCNIENENTTAAVSTADLLATTLCVQDGQITWTSACVEAPS